MCAKTHDALLANLEGKKTEILHVSQVSGASCDLEEVVLVVGRMSHVV